MLMMEELCESTTLCGVKNLTRWLTILVGPLKLGCIHLATQQRYTLAECPGKDSTLNTGGTGGGPCGPFSHALSLFCPDQLFIALPLRLSVMLIAMPWHVLALLLEHSHIDRYA